MNKQYEINMKDIHIKVKGEDKNHKGWYYKEIKTD